MKRFLLSLCLSLPTLVIAPIVNADDHAHHQALTVNFTNCTEFAGVAPVDASSARALVPAQFALDTNGTQAYLVVRVSDCQGISVANHRARPGRVAHTGIELISPDGTASNPNTGINNYTLSYASNVPELVEALNHFGVPAAYAGGLDYEYSPAQGPSELYAAVAPLDATSPTWFLHGTVTNPTYPSPFLANWWFAGSEHEVKMATTFPLINFDFSSVVNFYTSRNNVIGQLIAGNAINDFPVSYRGAYAKAQMVVTQPH
ncbi:hypothetical protein [Methylomonas sp. AM2-LC]|uniref:hypothetical protein n=1 Tax=Methylomonas sp. AM2-LC TaxID=3153301 RepID=UPI003267F09A